MFKEDECNSFKYWLAHWCAFQMTALNLHKWKLKYLLHDIEKPFLMLLWRNREKVRKFHVTHASHHPQGKPFKKIDLEAMLIDWECGRYTKEFSPMTARKFYEKKYKGGKGRFTLEEEKKIEKTLEELGL